MASSITADVIIYSNRQDIREKLKQYFKSRQAPNLVITSNGEECAEALERLPKGLGILDWNNDSQEDKDQSIKDIVHALRHSVAISGGRLRPLILLAENVDERIVAVASEYGISKVHTGGISGTELGQVLAQIRFGESMPKELKSKLDEVAEHRRNEDYAKASSILKTLHEAHPKNKAIRLDLGEALVKTGELADAKNILAPLINSRPINIRAIHLFAKCLMWEGQYEDACKLLTRATFFNAEEPDRLVDLGQVLLRLDRIEEASTQFDQAAELDPDHQGAKQGQGQVLLMQDQVNDALALLENSVGKETLASAFNTAAVLLIRQKKLQHGMKLYDVAGNALQDQPKLSARVLFNKGLGYRRMGRPADALVAFEEALKQDSTFAKCSDQLALLHQSNSFAGNQTKDSVVQPIEEDFDELLQEESFSF